MEQEVRRTGAAVKPQAGGVWGADKPALARAFGLIPRLKEANQRLEAFIRWTTGPAIAGIKPASLVSLPQSLGGEPWRVWGPGICRSLGLSALPLSWSPGRVLVLFFRRRRLNRKILNGIPRRYLQARSYPVNAGLAACLAYLQKRFAEAGKGASFPHEVGIFLGYPPEDVIGFSSGKRSPFPCRGYWRVYHRPERALRTFAYMDAARLALVEELLWRTIKTS
jgi:hypothetical protein